MFVQPPKWKYLIQKPIKEKEVEILKEGVEILTALYYKRKETVREEKDLALLYLRPKQCRFVGLPTCSDLGCYRIPGK